METINLERIHKDLMAMKKELSEIKVIIEKDVELADDFRDLTEHSEGTAKKLWDNKEDEVWDSV